MTTIPFDPDFDEQDAAEVPLRSGDAPSFFGKIPPRTAFIMGVVAAILSLGTVGFVVAVAILVSRLN